MKIKKIDIYSIIVGLVFIVSGISKSLDTTSFSQTINLYEFGNVEFISLIIILLEIYLGLSLFFKIQTKRVSFISFVFLTCLTLIFLYGWIFKDITDCGCFGKINFLNSSPTFTIVKNIILIYLCVDLWLSSLKEPIDEKWFVNSMFILSMSIVGFMSGFTLNNNVTSTNKKPKKKIAVKDSHINDVVKLSSDTTYLVFAFSYSCPHCMNSIENLKQYEKSGLVEKVIGIAVEDADKKELFNERYNPNFDVVEVSKDDITEITSSLPRSFYVRNDTIQFTLSGALPSAYVLKDIFDKKGKVSK